MPLIPLLRRFAERRVDPRPLAVVRIAIGVAALIKGIDLALEQWSMLAGAPARAPYLFEVPEVVWTGIPVLLGVWMIAASLLAVGLFSRTGAWTLAALAGLLLALDQRLYGSHFYLLALICLLLAVSECGAALSLDSRRRGASRSIPAWPATLLKIQISLVYGFTGLAKINPSFLSGEVLDEVLCWSGPLALPTALCEPVGLLVMSGLVIAVELFLAFGLWVRRLRPAAFVLGLGLHLFIVIWIPFYGFQLVVFAIESLAIYVLFLDGYRSTRRSSS